MEGNVSAIRLFFAFLRLGCTAFGGPAMVKYIQDLVCKRHQWVDEKDFRQGVALVQTIPGATAMQAAAYAGLRAGRGIGSLAAYVGFGLPAMMLMLVLTWIYQNAMDISMVVSAFNGLKVIVVAIVLNALISFGKKIVKGLADGVLAAVAAGIIAAGYSPVAAIIVSGLAGIFLYSRAYPQEVKADSDQDEKFNLSWFFSRNEVRFALWCILAVLAILAILLLLEPKLFQFAVMMMKIDFFAYGGGYASLPLMFHELVDKRGLMDAKVLMDGTALGQVTPGPIVITATFAGLILYGLAGALVGSWAIFTPSFLILLFAAPVFHRLRDDYRFRRVMRGVLASFVGLLAAVLYSFVIAISWTIPGILLAVAATAALLRGVDILYVVLAGAIVAVIFL